MIVKLTTKLVKARAGSASLKTTVPGDLAEYLKLKPGDTLEWEPLTPSTTTGDKAVVTVNLTKAKPAVQPKSTQTSKVQGQVVVYREPVARPQKSRWAGLD